jgi:hypothetical protein
VREREEIHRESERERCRERAVGTEDKRESGIEI